MASTRIAVPLRQNIVKRPVPCIDEGHEMALRVPSFRRYPPPDLRTVVLGHRILGPLLLMSWLVLRYSGLDEGDGIWGLALVIWGLSMIAGLGGAARILLSRGSLKYGFRIPSALLAAGFVLAVARWNTPGSGPFTTSLEKAFGVMTLAAAVLGIWVGWSTSLHDTDRAI